MISFEATFKLSYGVKNGDHLNVLMQNPSIQVSFQQEREYRALDAAKKHEEKHYGCFIWIFLHSVCLRLNIYINF